MKTTKVWVAVSPGGHAVPQLCGWTKTDVRDRMLRDFDGTMGWARMRKAGWTIQKAVIAPSATETVKEPDHG